MTVEAAARSKVQTAESEARSARRELARLDVTTVHPSVLVEKEAAVRLADLRLGIARKDAAAMVAAEHQAKVDAGERRRRRVAAASRQVSLEQQLRAIRSGAAAKAVESHHYSDAAIGTIPTTEEAFKAKYPDFVEGASHYEGPLQ